VVGRTARMAVTVIEELRRRGVFDRSETDRSETDRHEIDRDSSDRTPERNRHA